MILFQSDQALVREALQGSGDAWDRLVKKYESKVYNYGLRFFGSPDQAMDLLQETFFSVFKNLHQFDGTGSFVGWLMRIASNRAVDQLRKKNPAEPKDDPEPGFDQLQDRGPNQLDHLERGLDRQAIIEAMSQIPADQRIIVELKFFQGMTLEEIAQTVDTSTNTVKSRFYSALRKLKVLLEANYVT